MRAQFASFAKKALIDDPRYIVFLGDISVGLFLDRNNSLPERCLNLGILEQSMISMAAGMARLGFIPIVHTISPFMIERCYEQIKLDLSYNECKCILVSANGPFDYNKLGPTHHCAADIPLLSLLPNFEFSMPGRLVDLIPALDWAFKCDSPNYIRLSSTLSDDESINAGEIIRSSRNEILMSESILSIYVGEALAFKRNDYLSSGHDFLYVWNINQLPIEEIKKYRRIDVWEPYSLGVVSEKLRSSLDRNCKLRSYCYPKQLSDAIFESPYFICSEA